MSGKVKLTQEQADAINSLKVDKSNRALIVINLNVFGGIYLDTYRSIIQKMEFDDLIKALYIGYEIEPEYKSDDWVVWETREDREILEFKHYSSDDRSTFFDFRGNEYNARYIQRLATPEEIEAEKECRAWAKIDREVEEFKVNDVYVNEFGVPVRIFDENQLKELSKEMHNRQLKGIYPAESFISFEEGDSND